MKIITIKKTNNKYKITLENGETISTYDEIILKTNILYTKEITEEQLKTITKENQYYEIYNKTLKYIKTKLRSEKEIEKYLEKTPLTEQQQKNIIKNLKQQKLIDDNIYVKAFIHDKILFSPDGPNKIKKELQKQFSFDIIEKEFSSIDKQKIKEKLEKQISKKINSNTKYSPKMLKQKILYTFINMGYEKQDILEIIEKEPESNINIIEKEYYKQYNKLKTKYSNQELKTIIKQKLFQKGFEYDEINNIVNKKIA